MLLLEISLRHHNQLLKPRAACCAQVSKAADGAKDATSRISDAAGG